MKKIFLAIIFSVLIISPLLSGSVLAQQGYVKDVNQQLGATAGTEGANYGTPRDPRAIVAQVIQILMGTVGIIFVAYTVYAGYLILTSGGNEEKMSEGRKILTYAILGVVISLSTYSIALFAGRYFRQLQPGLNGFVQSNGWYAEGGVNIEGNSDQFYNPDPLEQNTQIYPVTK